MTRISIIGLGAMGATWASKLAGVPGVEIVVIADGPRADRLAREGVTVNGVGFDFPVVRPDDVPMAPTDLLIVAVKHTGLDVALTQVRHHVGESTIVLSLLNGITSEDEIAAAYPACHPLASITVGIDAVRVGQDVTYKSVGRLEFGERVNTEPYSPEVRWLASLLEQAGIEYVIPPDMTRQLWWKFLINTGVNQVTAVLEAPYAVVQTPGPAREMMAAAQREVIAVAQAKGIDLTQTDFDAWLGVLNGMAPGQYTSMAQDTLAHRPTEVDIFAGAMVRMGAETGVPVPVNTALLRLLKAKEMVWSDLAPKPEPESPAKRPFGIWPDYKLPDGWDDFTTEDESLWYGAMSDEQWRALGYDPDREAALRRGEGLTA